MGDVAKPVHWISSSQKDLREFPKEVRSTVGVALYEAQTGRKPDDAKPLKGFSGAGVLEVVANHDGDTYRAVYTVRFAEVVYVLHCFQKNQNPASPLPRARWIWSKVSSNWQKRNTKNGSRRRSKRTHRHLWKRQRLCRSRL